jgi:hypothetical protein
MKRTGWSKSANLITGQTTKIVTLSAEFEEPTSFTAQFDVDQEETSGFAIAVVEWTVNGITISRTIDVAAGASICGVAESVHVLVKDVTDVSVAGGFTAGQSYGVTISVAARTRANTAVPPVFTGLRMAETFPVPAPGAVAEVPPGANSVAIFGADVATGGPVSLGLLVQGFTVPDVARTLLQSVPQQGFFTPLVAGSMQVSVLNLGVTPAFVTIVFGIDG